MKKFTSILFAGVAILVLSGCGGGSSDSGEYSPITYYLQTYDDRDSIYRGVSGIEYDCGPDFGVTDQNGAFELYEGDICTFYGLDETLSLSIFRDELYIDSGLVSIDYVCDSDTSTIYNTEVDGMFIFDPYFEPVDITLPLGDICEFQF